MLCPSMGRYRARSSILLVSRPASLSSLATTFIPFLECERMRCREQVRLRRMSWHISEFGACVCQLSRVTPLLRLESVMLPLRLASGFGMCPLRGVSSRRCPFNHDALLVSCCRIGGAPWAKLQCRTALIPNVHSASASPGCQRPEFRRYFVSVETFRPIA